MSGGDERQYLRMDEWLEKVGRPISYSTACRLASKRQLDAFKIGGVWMVAVDALDTLRKQWQEQGVR